MTRTSDTVRTHLQRCRTLGEGLLKLCAHQSPYTGRTHRLFPPPQAASVHPRFEPTATSPSRATSRDVTATPIHHPTHTLTHTHTHGRIDANTYEHTRTRTHTRAYRYIHTQARTHIHTHAHTHTRTNTYTH